MKNIFKLLGVALIAGSMLFVACEKDPEENNNQNPTDTTSTTPTDTTSTPTDTTTTPTDPTTTMVMTIDGESYDIAEFAGGTYSSSLYLFPEITRGWLQIESATTVGTHDTIDMGNSWGAMWFDADSTVRYFNYNGTDYCRWEGMFGDAIQTISAIDLNANTISMVYSETMLDCEEYFNNGNNVVYMEFVVTLENAEWTVVNLSKKGIATKLRK